MNAAQHLQMTRIVRFVGATIAVGLLLPFLFTGETFEFGWAEAPWIIAALFSAVVIPGIVQSAMVARCRNCAGPLKVRTANFPQRKDKTGYAAKEIRYWCSGCKTAERFPSNVIDSLFTWEGQSSSGSNSNSPGDSFGE